MVQPRGLFAVKQSDFSGRRRHGVVRHAVHPLFIDALGLGRVSVGPPYFNALFVPLAVVLFVFMGIGPLAPWSRPDSKWIWQQMRWVAVGSIVAGLLVSWLWDQRLPVWTVLGIACAIWLAMGSLIDLYYKIRGNRPLERLRRLGAGYTGMVIAHLGVAVVTFGVAMVSGFVAERDGVGCRWAMSSPSAGMSFT